MVIQRHNPQKKFIGRANAPTTTGGYISLTDYKRPSRIRFPDGLFTNVTAVQRTLTGPKTSTALHLHALDRCPKSSELNQESGAQPI